MFRYVTPRLRKCDKPGDNVAPMALSRSVAIKESIKHKQQALSRDTAQFARQHAEDVIPWRIYDLHGTTPTVPPRGGLGKYIFVQIS
jgi:hypothetical protein